ncbi:glycosyltransferase family 2 protein [Nonlabens agnitus]|uniref:Glycosyl transferase family 2 n=1 Tax=Nonlabens agnitus TaxID=870484 RepID=A0A2S9WU22_9FLAO|nr:glycosyltransferase family A protein [Nonlabens agnitus]PRP66982.1 glycosyl transferase family 2 [Nonlabens agnitus]
MIEFIQHPNSKDNLAFHNGVELVLITGPTINQLIALAKSHPKEWIGWSKSRLMSIDWLELKRVANKPYKMVSKGAAPCFLTDYIDYIEDTPFINFKENYWYPTWIMSTDLGLIHSSVLVKVGKFNSSNNFEYDLNLISRKIQPQGVFCYSKLTKKSICRDQNSRLFLFVAQSRKARWLLFLLLCFIIFEKKFPLFASAKAMLLNSSHFNPEVEFSYGQNQEPFNDQLEYDVIIPTIGRPNYLKNVLRDLDSQQLKPKKVIIIEQNTVREAVSELNFLEEELWGFEIIHSFTHKAGACRARNEAISKTTAPWILLFDDDNRFSSDLMQKVARSLNEIGCKVLNFAYLQEGESENQKGYLQWAFFGSGCSIVHRDAIKKCRFDQALEYGYGEDADYGMQLRNNGFDVIYAPEIQVQHLKAPVGGFRQPVKFDWSDDELKPQPSPHVMYFRRKNYTSNQLHGYKLKLFFQNYLSSATKNPWRYYKQFNKRWQASVYYSERLTSSI